MSSGIGVTDEVKDLFVQMKVVKHDGDQNDRIRLVVFHIKDKFIEVETILREKDLEGKDVFKCFQGLLKADQCRYILYDCHFESKESSKKEELVFVLWSPDDAKVKDKMTYASSASCIRKAVDGVKHNLEIHDVSDCMDVSTFGEKLEKGITKMEGTSCRH